MMIRKIDNSLQHKVNALENIQDNIDCLVYVNNFQRAKNFLKRMGACIVEEFPFINALGVNIKAKTLKDLSLVQSVKYITSQPLVYTEMNVARRVTNIKTLQEEGFTGKGVTVAVIDTGIKPHIDFILPKNRIKLFKDFVNEIKEPYDDNGHGTFVSSVLLGNGFCSGKKFCGVAYNSNIIMLKALDKNGETGAFKILEAMQWVYENAEKYNIRVVCMSFGSIPQDRLDPLMLGAESLWNKGIVVVAAAGNSGPEYNTIKSPGISGKIITVGALDDKRTENGEFFEQNFEVANFSSRGPAFNYYKPDCIAPGVNINGAGIDSKEQYTKMSGTSVATPIVAGMCSLLIEKNPNLTPTEIKSIILKSCKKITGERNSEGFGYIVLH